MADISGEVTFIGTATVLIRFGGITLLTDPNFLRKGERAYVGMGLSTKRLTDPAMGIADLPPLDLVVLSHHHGDHFDRIAASELDKQLPIVTEPHAARKLQRQGFERPVALETWQTYELTKDDTRLTVTAVPGKHAPQPLGLVIPPVMGSILDFSDDSGARTRMYITGDTLLHDRLAEIPRRFPDIDLCLIHLGGTKVAGILLTMDGAQGVKALELVNPREAIPIHYDDYTLFRSPLDDFKRAAEAAHLDCDIKYLSRGQTYRFDVASRS